MFTVRSQLTSKSTIKGNVLWRKCLKVWLLCVLSSSAIIVCAWRRKEKADAEDIEDTYEEFKKIYCRCNRCYNCDVLCLRREK